MCVKGDLKWFGLCLFSLISSSVDESRLSENRKIVYIEESKYLCFALNQTAMFNAKNKTDMLPEKTSGNGTTLIGAGTILKGDITSNSDLRIETGRWQGQYGSVEDEYHALVECPA